MNKYLVFRTDRIGDFLLSAILIKSIKDKDKDSHVTVVSSKKNYEYIKSYKLVDEVFLLNNNFFEKIKLIVKLRKLFFHSIILHDNKKRSHLISLFLNAKKKIIISKCSHLSHIEIIKKILNKCNFNFDESSLDFLEAKNIDDFKMKDFIHLHFDEKWIHDNYIKNYINIEPSKKQLSEFLNLLITKTSKKLVITTGLNSPKVLDEAIKERENVNILYFKNLSFLELEKVVIKSDVLISCHGSISHLAAAKKIKQIDIIDKSYNYSRWTKHFRNYTFIYRDNFSNLTQQILGNLRNF